MKSYKAEIMGEEISGEMALLHSIGSKAREWREKHYSSIEHLAKAANVEPQEVLDLENGTLSLSKARGVFRKLMDTDLTVTEARTVLELLYSNDDLDVSGTLGR